MSADVLREAARLMRERAEAAHTPEGLCASWFEDGCSDLAHLPKEQAHIASWHPAVAVAVADWLEATARELDALGDPELAAHPLDGRRTAALAVARAYLGVDQ